MPEFTAKDVQALRNLTGAGMMDAKRALTESDGDPQAAAKWLRERGLGKAAERAGRESQEGAVAVSYDKAANAIALVQLRSETDFGAKSPDFVNLVNELAALVASEGEDAVDQRKSAIEDLNIDYQGERPAGGGRPFPGCSGQRGRLLPARAERPGRQRRDRGDRRRRPATGPRHRRAHRLRQAEVPAPRGRAERGGRGGAGHSRSRHPQ